MQRPLTITLALGLLAGPSYAGTVRYVDDDAPAGGDGLSWQTAYRFLQDALADAGFGPVGDGIDEIRVAQGTYLPDRSEASPGGTGEQAATFGLIDGVSVLGGFAGIGARDPDERDPARFETVLGGDLAGDDVILFPVSWDNSDDNSYTVVTATASDPTAVLDGVTIRQGYAVPDTENPGGMLIVDGSPTVSNCRFELNTGFFGGGAHVTGGSPSFVGCTFLNNNGGEGGGIEVTGGSPAIHDCLFDFNVAGAVGGGISVRDAAIVATASTFDANLTGLFGGAGISNFNGDVTLERCDFIANDAVEFGGAIAHFGGALFARRCRFIDNIVIDDGFGGALAVVGGVEFPADATLLNCLFSGNVAVQLGGAVFNSGEGAVTELAGCTLAGNVAGVIGGGVVNDLGAVTVAGTIVWANAPDQVFGVDSILYSDVQGGFPGTGNIDADPRFVDPGSGDLRLGAGSPCADAGNNWVLAGRVDGDLDGAPRFAGLPTVTGCGEPVIVDMGAYERAGEPADILFGDLDADGSVGTADLLALLAAWGTCPAGCCLADLDIDGTVGAGDLLALLAGWG